MNDRFAARQLGVLRHLSSRYATRCFPKLCRCRLPVKRVLAWTVLFQMREARDSLLDARPMPGRYPPQHHGWTFKMLEPIDTAAVKALVNRLPDKLLQCVDVLPNRKIDDDARVGVRPRVGGAAAVVDKAPDKSGAAFGDAVHQSRLFVKSAMRGSSISYLIRPMFSSAR